MQNKKSYLNPLVPCFFAALALFAAARPAEAKISSIFFKGVTKHFKPGMEDYSPTLGAAALESGSIDNWRFDGNFERGYKNEQRGDENIRRRQYAADKGKDAHSEILATLFPSNAGKLTSESAHVENFGRHANPGTVALLMNYAYLCRQNCPPSYEEEVFKSVENSLNAIWMKDRTKRKFQDTKIKSLLAAIQKAVATEEISNFPYPKYSTELILSSFFVLKFNTRADIWALLNALHEDIVDKTLLKEEAFLLDVLSKDSEEKGKYFADYFEKLKTEQKPYDLDEVFALATSSIWSSPTLYREEERLISNGNATPYNRLADRSEGQSFADCTETSWRHIAQLLHFDSDKRIYDLSFLNTPEVIDNPYSKNYFRFFDGRDISTANAGDSQTRTDWVKVSGDLNGGENPILDDAQKIDYVTGNNELNAGFINLLKAYHRVIALELISPPSAEQSLDEKREWLKKMYNRLFSRINPTKNYDFDMTQVTESPNKRELEGNMIVTVSDGEKQLYSYTIYAKKDRHCEVAELTYKQKPLDFSDALAGHATRIVPNTAQDVLWLLAAQPELKQNAQHPWYQLFKSILSDNNARVEFLKALETNLNKDDSWFGLKESPTWLNTFVANVLEDISWNDRQVLSNVSPVLMRLSNYPALQPALESKVLGLDVDVSTQEEFSSIASMFSSLQHLYLWASLDSIEGFDKLAELTTLDLSKTIFEEISLAGLRKLKKLLLNGDSLLKLNGVNDLTELVELHLFNAIRIEDISIAGLRKLKKLSLIDSSIRRIHGLDTLTELALLDLFGTKNLEEISLVGLRKLEQLNLQQSSVKKIDGINDLTELTVLNLSETKNLNAISLQGLKKLQAVDLNGSSIQNFTGQDLDELHYIRLSRMNSLKYLHLQGVKKLNDLHLRNLPALSTLILPNLSLQYISVSGLRNLKIFNLPGSSVNRIDGLNDLTELTELDLSETKNLEDVWIKELRKLSLVLLRGSSIRRFTGIDLDALFSLDFEGAKSLERVRLERVKNLSYLDLTGIPFWGLSLEDLPNLSYLNIDNTESLIDLSLKGTIGLQSLDVSKSRIKEEKEMLQRLQADYPHLEIVR